MKVLVLSQMFPDRSRPHRGIFVAQQVRQLIATGCEVSVVAPMPWVPLVLGWRKKYREYRQVPVLDSWDGLELFRPRAVLLPAGICLQYQGRLYAGSLHRFLNRIHESHQFDLIHAHVAMLDGVAGAQLSRAWNVPLVVTIHGGELTTTLPRYPQVRSPIAIAMKQAAAVAFVGTKIARLAIEEQLVKPNRVLVVPNGVDPEEILAVVPPPRNHSTIHLVSVANLVRLKRLHLVLEALSRVIHDYPRICYTIVGDGPERKFLEDQTRQLHLQCVVNFIGARSHGEALQTISGCDIFVLPSAPEGFGIAHLEAMSLGKTVVACRGEGPEDFIEDGKNGFLVKPGSVEQLTELLFVLLRDSALRQAVGHCARETVLTRFTWKRNAEEYRRIYELCLSRHKSSFSWQGELQPTG